ncbi:unnamed protein product [Tuber melanosporum]|uniref:Thiamine pyrophosphokinase n=1 Tax=Tuber melanosporum (strain Mel28) TaxID=656061 RepID=D5G621_TUBMM|nr:uncharacterized protein GSTUM_00001732001 [Tuber melanosporum]CAZ79964.1 unnamed protein product [Tuber melanosporum]
MGAEQSTEATIWMPGDFFDSSGDEGEDNQSFALIILNQEITNLKLFETLYKNSKLVICADGGANRLYDAYTTEEDRFSHAPACIAGDLDSLRPDVQSYYSTLGVEILKVVDQDLTDFEKCLSWISEQSKGFPPILTPPGDYRTVEEEMESGNEVKISGMQPEITVLALGGFGGRVDHSFHSINILYRTAYTHSIYLISSENITFLLPVGDNTIFTPHSVFGPTCGILPVGYGSVMTTSGLVWDLQRQESKFGGLVSTSNRLESEVIHLHLEGAPAVFTLELRKQAPGIV